MEKRIKLCSPNSTSSIARLSAVAVTQSFMTSRLHTSFEALRSALTVAKRFINSAFKSQSKETTYPLTLYERTTL